jgi:hypothetical protein
MIGAVPAQSQDKLGDIRFSLSVSTATPERTVSAGSVISVVVEMRNSSLFPVLATAGYRDPPIELHIWNAGGEDIVKPTASDITNGSAFKETATRRLVAVRFDAGEQVRVRIYLPMRVIAGEYQIGVRTAVQRDASDSRSVVVVDSNHLAVTVCNK